MADPVTDYGDENPLLYDYYGFKPALYQLKFKSRGDATVSQRVVLLLKEVSGDHWSLSAQQVINHSLGRLSRANNEQVRI